MDDTVVRTETLLLAYVPGHFKTRKVCDRAVRKERLFLLFVPDCFMTQQQVKYLQDDIDDWYNNKLTEWYDGYQKRKAQKARIKEEFLSIA